MLTGNPADGATTVKSGFEEVMPLTIRLPALVLQTFNVPVALEPAHAGRKERRRRHLDLGHRHLLESEAPRAATARSQIQVDVASRRRRDRNGRRWAVGYAEFPTTPGVFGSVTSCQRVPPFELRKTPESAPPATRMSGSVGIERHKRWLRVAIETGERGRSALIRVRERAVPGHHRVQRRQAPSRWCRHSAS